MEGAPFRSPDLAARVEALREKRDALVSELGRVERELRALRPWSWLRFFIALAAPTLLMLIASALVALLVR